MSTRFKLMTFLLGSVCILALQAVRATPAAAEPSIGCFNCEGGFLTEDGWDAHLDFFAFFNPKHGNVHAGVSRGPCQVHLLYNEQQ